ncbi:protein HIRA-like isoform X1 [Anopheles sinensis]|uniref:Protein HIRA-like isoform X1 n=1 Tax=Anopheles sinensis TaxID=74873 RepID=A0A084WG90_ANOSI|nr:protein HIRA-like isoform X1 [Anopheles sinensis]
MSHVAIAVGNQCSSILESAFDRNTTTVSYANIINRGETSCGGGDPNYEVSVQLVETFDRFADANQFDMRLQGGKGGKLTNNAHRSHRSITATPSKAVASSPRAAVCGYLSPTVAPSERPEQLFCGCKCWCTTADDCFPRSENRAPPFGSRCETVLATIRTHPGGN